MRMTVVPEPAVRDMLDQRGAKLLDVEQVGDGPVRTVTYFVAPRP